MEICLDGHWESTCLLSQNAVNVACRALGFSEFEQLTLDHRAIPPVIDMVLFPPVDVLLACNGTEKSLAACTRMTELGRRAVCSASDAVRVQCLGNL